LSVSVCGPVMVEPGALDPAAPVVMPGWLLTPPPRLPDDCAVPAVLVPGAGWVASLEALPAPDGSLPELFNPPTLAGPDGTPLTPCVPAPAEPAFGEPTALLLPAEGPLAAPPALAPPALAPPPVPPPPPPFCANEMTGDVRIAIAAVKDALAIGNLLLQETALPRACSCAEPFVPLLIGEIIRCEAGVDDACAN
jgi:hypothetical protein